MKDVMGSVTYRGWDPFLNRAVTEVTYPVYACGHCSGQIAIRPDRRRERKTCLSCGRWICEKSELCNLDCTPLYAMAKDHFEKPGRHGNLLSAILNGASTLEEASHRGLIKEI